MRRMLIVLILLFPLMSFAYPQTPNHWINIHFSPHVIIPNDSLHDGPNGKKIGIEEDTFLIWVDLFPDMFFVHDTVYVLISREGIRVEKGEWWPVLNGRDFLYNEEEKFALICPYELPPVVKDGLLIDGIKVYVYPHKLSIRDRLDDGYSGRMFPLDDNCLLVWVDMKPKADFAHPTAYIIITSENIQVKHGNWWPVLNGRSILYGDENRIGILSPFKLMKSRLSR